MHTIPSEAGVDRRPAQSGEQAGPPQSLRLLVVDGEPLIRWSLAAALEERGHRVIVAADREGALRALGAGPVDVILLDCHLADSANLELLRIIRGRTPQTPVVGMTAFPSRDLRRRAGELGAACLLEKPFDVFGVERVLLGLCSVSA